MSSLGVSKTDEALAHLEAQGYVVRVSGVPAFTSKMLEYLGVKQAVNGKQDMKELYKQFIVDCKIPRTPRNPQGGNYWVNQYSVGGQKAFERILKNSAINQERLKNATTYYYQVTPRPKTIQSFLEDGIWESFYDTAPKPAAGTSSSMSIEL